MSAEPLLSRLDGVKPTGPRTWKACCLVHKDRTPSVSIRELDDGRVLVHCFAGCSVEEILAAAGLTFDALYPPRPIQHGKPERRPFPAADVLRSLSREALVVAAAAVAICDGKALGQVDRERLILAASRINAAVSVAGLS